ncbi:MAG TPA: cytochrome P450 [Solirubrobacteraceae bacterium]|jgi:cytochrome P450|nr:cytochrome P450 [Solirubrobacteraceae bacterium]
MAAPPRAPQRDVGGCPVMHRDFAPPGPAGCYWDLAKELRDGSPVYFNTFAQGYWIFTRHDAVKDIYKTPELFSSESFTPWDPEPIYRFVPTQIDAPDHIKYRRILNPWFSPRAIEAAEDDLRALCRSLVEEVASKGATDFVSEFALRYPTEGFLQVIGIPPKDADLFVTWVEDFFAGFGGDPAGLERMTNALQGIQAYWAAALEERRAEAEPRPGDLASHLLHSTFDDRPLTDTEMLDMLTVLVLAGLDTTRAELGYMFRHLAEHPEERRRLIEEPELIPLAVEEVLRYYTIIFGDGRKVTRDVEFHGVELKQGEMVYGLVSAANRDPDHWERGEEFVIDRQRNNHMGFANGPHRCLGMHLARREMKIAVEEWLRLIPDFEIATEEQLTERGGGSMMTLLSLPLAWDVAS